MTAATNEVLEGLRASGANSPDTRPNSMFLAQSLASIDSEGSWLSGKPSRRLSQARVQFRMNTESREKLSDPVESPEERGETDEIFGVLGGEPVPEEEEEGFDYEIIPRPHEDEGTTWHVSVGKLACLISPNSRAKSRDGLFTDFLESASDIHNPDMEESAVKLDVGMVVRLATSVDLGKVHVRYISA